MSSIRNSLAASLMLILVASTITGCSDLLPKNGADESGTYSYLGIVSEVNSKSDEPNRLIRIDNEGRSSTVAELESTYFPSVEPVSTGFAIPDKNSISLFSKSLSDHHKLALTKTDGATLTRSASSNNGKFAAFNFNESSGEDSRSDLNVVVLTDGLEVKEIVNENYTSALTACDDGSYRWLENTRFEREGPQGNPGTVTLATFKDGNLSKTDLNHVFDFLPDGPNRLPCQNEPILLQSTTKFYSFSKMKERFELDWEKTAPPMPREIASRHSESNGAVFTIVGEDKSISAFQLSNVQKIIAEQLPDELETSFAARFDGTKIHLLASKNDAHGTNAIYVFDTEERRITEGPVVVQSQDRTPIGSSRTGEFHMIVSILPIRGLEKD